MYTMRKIKELLTYQ